MKKILIFLVLISSVNSFAGWDNPVKYKCENKEYKFIFKSEGSLGFGEDKVKLSEKGFFGKTLFNESYVQDWSGSRDSDAAKLAIKENPISNERFVYVVSSDSATVVMSVTGGSYAEEHGEKDAFYIQIHPSKDLKKAIRLGSKIVKFDIATECKRN